MAIVDEYEPVADWCVPFVDWRRRNVNSVHILAAESGHIQRRGAIIESGACGKSDFKPLAMEHSREDGELLDTSITPTVDIVQYEIPTCGRKGFGSQGLD